jgi:hypothetical protein
LKNIRKNQIHFHLHQNQSITMYTSTVVALATLASASAFVAPSAFAGNALATSVKSSSAMRMADASALEQGKPFGDDTIFDPLGLAEKATPLELKKYQEVSN